MKHFNTHSNRNTSSLSTSTVNPTPPQKQTTTTTVSPIPVNNSCVKDWLALLNKYKHTGTSLMPVPVTADVSIKGIPKSSAIAFDLSYHLKIRC
ncbi:hypothetical protein PPL_08357 [Heterostelium album PN500]|uniref:Uncharacterized protein n=1 Tax=Heterostelium pallidum (strain ATCC 26659 / Pp 5 / PN500) TaxID=670386 RepID=D3BHY9_HETP5|nr:hypothetical protein PPL_08357 [Heterostelium album PN500]EFA78889.1 hypothetical protein PPL_08357 [Heterostelium album PN500]|eukprot:XP_020431013.1 hypothetical protein PPL_08357 [Heterostelium album PN500]